LVSESALSVLKRRYFKKGENWEALCKRVATALSKRNVKIAQLYFDTMYNLHFLPNTPTLINAGTSIQQLSACYVLPIEDSIESIFDGVKHAALIHKSGGGTGFSFSRVREQGRPVQSTEGIASGPISFMKVYNEATGAIKQGGVRRGANMGCLRIDHPDIREFITCKDNLKELTNFNISVAVTDTFMEAVENDEYFELKHIKSPYSIGVKAKELFDSIAFQAHKNGEPGILFIDQINRFNPTPHLGKIEATNPCGELPLLPYEACNLGSINLSRMLQARNIGYTVDWGKLRDTIHTAVLFLNDVIDNNEFPLPQIQDITTRTRKIGLGVMGWADMLTRLQIPYESEEALSHAKLVMSFINETAHSASEDLAKLFGAYPECDNGPLIRNSALTTIAPTGSISMIADCSSGIEPHFSLAYTKTVMDGVSYKYINSDLIAALEQFGLWDKEVEAHVIKYGSIQSIPHIPPLLKEVFKTAQEISPLAHIKMQAAFQEHVDNAISKTINLPKTATVDDVKEIYLTAWRVGCKGVTVYRDGSRESQVLSIGYQPKDVKYSKCPECSGKLDHSEGCTTCVSCGWSACSG